MRKPKRLRFTPGARTKSDYQRATEGLRMVADALQPVAVGLSSAFGQMHNVVQKLVNLGEALLADPEFQQKMKMKQLYFDSWKQNELADTLAAAGIARAQ